MCDFVAGNKGIKKQGKSRLTENICGYKRKLAFCALFILLIKHIHKSKNNIIHASGSQSL